MTDYLDFHHLARRSSPNQWLVAPSDFRPALTVDDIAPVIALSASALAEKWAGTVKAKPRTVLLARSDDGLQLEAEQRSALFRFVDVISFRAIPIDDNAATFIAYSRSNSGYWDMGVNRRRLDAWVAALQR